MKRTLIILLAALLLLTTGCVKHNDRDGQSALNKETEEPTELVTEAPTAEPTEAPTDEPAEAPTEAPLYPETEFGGEPQPGEMPEQFPRTPDYGELPDEYRNLVANNVLHSSYAYWDCVLKCEGRFGFSGGERLTRYDIHGNEQTVLDAGAIEHEGVYEYAFPTSDGGFIIAYGGTIVDNVVEGPSARLAKVSKEGELLWMLELEDGYREMAKYCFELDGAYFLVGSYPAPDAEDVPEDKRGFNWDIFIAKISPEGKELKRVILGGSDYDYVYTAYLERDAVCMEARICSRDGEIAGLVGADHMTNEWYVRFDSELNPSVRAKAVSVTNRYSNAIGYLDGEAVLNKDEHETHNGIIDFGDHYIVAWENVLGFSPYTTIYQSSPSPVTETVYEAYSKDGTLLWRRATASSPDYKAYIESLNH